MKNIAKSEIFEELNIIAIIYIYNRDRRFLNIWNYNLKFSGGGKVEITIKRRNI